MQNASLVVVGSGIKFISHLTHEAKTYIQQSDIVLYLVNDPAMKEWIKENNPLTESLDALYTQYCFRKDCYSAITEYILKVLRKKQHVCVVLYGHPTVFSQPGLNAVLLARKEGYEAKVLPGISAEACLFADLLINPGDCGCQSFEATDFLIRQRTFDPYSHLILWQVDVIGRLDNPQIHDNTQGTKLLVEYLARSYQINHEVIIYEAAQYPGFDPTIERKSLEQLIETCFSRISTVYIPPLPKKANNQKILNFFNILD